MKLLRNILKGASLSTALFIFQACYGVPMDLDEELFQFKFVSAVDGSPIKDVEVSSKNPNDSQWRLLGYSGTNGLAQVYLYTSEEASYDFRFNAGDDVYAVKDTTIKVADSDKVYEIVLQKK